MDTEIRHSIEQEFTIVTPTKRLSRALRKQYISKQLSEQKKTWETPDILPWAVWISRIWDDFTTQQDSAPMLLKPQQRKWVWQKIVAESSIAKEFLQPAAVYHLAYDAWKTMCQWQLDIFPEGLWLNKDNLAFKSWVTTFQQQCKKHNWLDIASLEGYLLNDVSQWAAYKAEKIHLFGFDELTPVQEALLKAMQQEGCKIKQDEIKQTVYARNTNKTVNLNTVIVRRAYADTRHEIKAIAYWLREQLSLDSSASIGVVVPDLENLRADIENIFDDVLTPCNLFATDSEINNARPYNFSLGKPLSDYPVIHTAFEILGLEKKIICLEDLGALLRSPFLGGAETEMIARAELDAYLKEKGEPEVSLTIFQKYLEKNELWSKQCPQFIASLQKWHEVLQRQAEKQTCIEWIKSFIDLLNTFAWPGERNKQGDELQTIETWRGLFDQFASLDLVSGKLTYHGALSLLQSLAREQIYQVESDEVPVQIMGLLEASGLQFDKLWVMGLHEEKWPLMARANPFLPVKLQRENNMPHASAERELEYARGVTSRLEASANEVFFSSPLNEAGRALKPSPLLKHLPLQKIEQSSYSDYAEMIFDSSKMEYFYDDVAPEVKESKVGGGTTLFKDQAACPFRAFAKHRLGAKPLAKVDIGLSAIQRGQLVHECLQLFWEKISTHEELIGLSDDALQLNINQCVAKVVKHFQAKHLFMVTRRFMLIEQGRLEKMMHEWLSLEKCRQPFTVVEREQEHAFTIEGLKIQTRVDRIDQLPDGSFIIIDYKTGMLSSLAKCWIDERPDEPQLPLYAVKAEGNIAAVVFAHIKPGEMKFVGLVDDVYAQTTSDDASAKASQALIPGVQTLKQNRAIKEFPDWESLFLFWKKRLQTLAENYRKGDAHVDPHKGNNTCRYCGLETLCRIDEIGKPPIYLSDDDE